MQSFVNYAQEALGNRLYPLADTAYSAYETELQPRVIRNAEHIEREYNREKYNHDCDSMQDMFLTSLRGLPTKKLVSMSGKFYYAPTVEISMLFERWLQDLLSHFKPLCELGCGFGINIDRHPAAYGGELTDNGVKLARKFGLDVDTFNFYHIEDYSIIRPGSYIATVAAIEQLPTAAKFIEGLRSQKSRIKGVINIEPLQFYADSSKLGEARRKYCKHNDYNTDLLQLLQPNRDIEIQHLQKDIFGFKPENTLSYVHWQFV